MTLAFTICSINYLAQAQTLGQSLQRTNPDVEFVIGLVDRLDKVTLDSDKIPPFQLLEIDKINIVHLEEMCDNYDITELNTAVKPFYFDYFFKNRLDINKVIYFDPDIIVFDSLQPLTDNLEKYHIVLTPHITSPINDKFDTREIDHLNTGLYNLGFVAVSRHPKSYEMINWWMERLAKDCRIDLCNGLFVDQHWMIFVPIFYKDIVLVDKYPGYNVAYWNLHERKVTEQNGKYFINELPLIFFHFSGYGLNNPTEVSKYQNRSNFDNRPDIVPLFQYYAQQLVANYNDYYNQFSCHYIKPIKTKRYQRIRRALKYPFERILDFVA
ncbi:MAG: glycosyl transferase [Arcicella sp.]|nr:glycosyl transferase [Arcicella sp.]